jgi:hypothetical protein
VCALSTPKEKSTAVLSAIKRGEGGKPIANANRPFQSEFTRVQAWGKRNEEPQIQIPTVIKWIIPDATCVVVLTATSSVRLAKRNSRLLASSYKNAAAAAAFVVVFARGQNATELLVRMRRRRRDPLFAYIAPPAVFNLARLRLYSQGSKAASAGSFRCHLSATATRCSHAAILIATANRCYLSLDSVWLLPLPSQRYCHSTLPRRHSYCYRYRYRATAATWDCLWCPPSPQREHRRSLELEFVSYIPTPIYNFWFILERLF